MKNPISDQNFLCVEARWRNTRVLFKESTKIGRDIKAQLITDLFCI